MSIPPNRCDSTIAEGSKPRAVASFIVGTLCATFVVAFFGSVAGGAAAFASTAQPSASNTGVPAVSKLTTHYGDMVITTAGTVVSNLDIHGFVSVKAANVTIKNSIVRGGKATADRGLIQDSTTAGKNLQIIDTTILPAYPSVYEDGITGFNYTATRVNISHTVDGAKMFGNNATIRNSYIHDLDYYAHDPMQGGGHTHNDGVQVLSGSNNHIQSNFLNIAASLNSGIQVTQDHGAVNGLYISDNWANGGGCTFNLSNKGSSTPIQNVQITGGRFGRSTHVASCAVVCPLGAKISASNNRYWDDNQAVKVRWG